MNVGSKLIKGIIIPKEYRKRTTIVSNIYYDKIEIYCNKVVGYLNGQQNMTWYFKEYTGIDIVKANMNSQFAQIVFLTGINAKNRAVGVDLFATQNLNAVKDTNRILLCSGMFSFGKTNDFANYIGKEIRIALEGYKDNDVVKVSNVIGSSNVDEIRKLKELLDESIITQDEFDAKKKQLLGI